LVTDLADARDETMVITAEPVDLVDVLEQVRDVMRDRLAARDVTWQLPPRPCAVELDPDSFGRAVRNLVDNATKFSEPDTPIEVRVTADDTEMTIRITDHGPGIADEARTQLFRRFARLDSTRRGLGLGLHVTRRIIRAHAGDVTHEPTPTRGATFVVRMPRRPSRGIR
jgi:signal transduction histidine kinase